MTVTILLQEKMGLTIVLQTLRETCQAIEFACPLST